MEENILANQYPSEQEIVRLRVEILFIFLGIIWGAIISYFAASYLLGLILDSPNTGGFFASAFLVLSLGIGAIMGGVIGYRIFKYSKYSKY